MERWSQGQARLEFVLWPKDDKGRLGETTTVAILGLEYGTDLVGPYI
jgi:hypothetical protein